MTNLLFSSASAWAIRIFAIFVATTLVRSNASEKAIAASLPAHPFTLEALVDFPDDTLFAGRALTPSDLDALMTKLAALGIRRVAWIYYGDGHGGFIIPSSYSDDAPLGYKERSEWKYYADTYKLLGNPLKVAVEAGHRHGLEVYAYYKFYETGPAIQFPEGSIEAKEMGLLDCIGGRLSWMDSFVRTNPTLRIKRRTDDIPDWVASSKVQVIRLTKKDASPTRVTAEHLQIWTSPNNYRYQPAKVKFTVAETVEPAKRDVRDQNGNILTHEGDAVRTLTLSGLNLEDKYILITTDFESGKPDFTNSGLALLTAYDEQGREIPGVVASGGTIWAGNLVDFRNKGLVFDYGWGSTPISLDAPNASGKNGFLAFARGRNAYLPGALCETEPKVQEFWLKCLDEIIAAGVDGVDFRDENHSTHTDHPEEYGFNPAVLAKAQARPGNLLKNIADVRGEAYTEFLRECHRRLSKAGIPMRYNLQLDFYRPNPPANRLLAYPANINFQWQRWIDEGMLEGSILRFFSLPFGSLFDDSIARDMIARSQKRDMKITVNRYIEVPGEKLTDEVLRIKSDGRFDGYIFYETGSYIKYGPNPGDCSVNYPLLIKATTAARGL